MLQNLKSHFQTLKEISADQTIVKSIAKIAKEAKVLWACRKTAAYQELPQDWSEMVSPLFTLTLHLSGANDEDMSMFFKNV